MRKQRRTPAQTPPVAAESAPAAIPFGCDPKLKHTVHSGAEQAVGYYREGWKSVPIGIGHACIMADAEMAAHGLDFLLKLMLGDAEASEMVNDANEIVVECFSHRERMQVALAARALIHTVSIALGETRESYATGRAP